MDFFPLNIFFQFYFIIFFWQKIFLPACLVNFGQKWSFFKFSRKNQSCNIFCHQRLSFMQKIKKFEKKVLFSKKMRKTPLWAFTDADLTSPHTAQLDHFPKMYSSFWHFLNNFSEFLGSHMWLSHGWNFFYPSKL